MKSIQNMDNQLRTWRLLIFYGAIAVVFGYYFYRLLDYQVLNSALYVESAYENRHSTLKTQTTRGLIYDRNGYILAKNIASYNVVITTANLPDDEGETQKIYRELSELIDVPALGPTPDETMAKNFTACGETQLAISQIVYIQANFKPYTAVEVKCNIDEETALVIREKSADWPGVSIETSAIREYPTGELTAEIVGFLGPVPAESEDIYPDKQAGRDKVGYSGIEVEMEDELGGTNGVREIEVDGNGMVMGDLEVPIDPVPGNSVVLTIDTRLQAAAKAALDYELDYLHANSSTITEDNGVVIVMNPRTGEILALVSHPTFENNRMTRIIPSYYYQQLVQDPDRPLLNHAISAAHAPGSVFKMSTSIGILNEGVVTPEQTVDDPGKIYLTETITGSDLSNQRAYYCYAWQTGGHGSNVDFLTGFSQSCDVYFYKVGGGYPGQVEDGGLGIWRLGEYAQALGYGLLTGIELPGEAEGNIPDPDWKRLVEYENWSTGDTYISAIGQGYVTSTPLQVLRSIATLANDGVMVKPTLIKEILDSEGNVVEVNQPVEICDITSECRLKCDVETNKCRIDTLGVCDPEAGTCRVSSDPDAEIDPDYYSKMGGVINVMNDNGDATGELKTVAPWVVQLVQEAMRLVVTNGTATSAFEGFEIDSAGKTGTAEYCDDIARARDICKQGQWPAHAWYAGYAPAENPEIAVVAFVYHGQEGSVIAAPVVRKVMDAYFELKEIDQGEGVQ